MESPHRREVRVRATARLHLGFLDLNGGLHRRFGSLGLSLDGPVTEVAAVRSRDFRADGEGGTRAEAFARALAQQLHLDGGVSMELSRCIPEHAGLGSGTQLALAVGTAVARLHDLEVPPERLAGMLGRGRRSGIGIATFESGGLVMDGGRGPESPVPPVLSRMPVPGSWRFLLVLDRAAGGISGDRETEAFSRLGDMSAETCGELCRLAVMQVLPAVAENDCRAFGAAVSRIQEIQGQYFSPAQGGPCASNAVAEALMFLRNHGAAGSGQTSWGPTGFAVFGSETDAFQALRRARARRHDRDQLDFVLCRARNSPAVVRVDDAVVKSAGRRR